jgi:catechol 2,3-dioxygenase-like lactoylglutathione lyase family enzyme
MRFRGVHHVEFSVLDYEKSVAFYDRMFGWLGYKSFWTLGIGYTSTYYMARFPVPHSYIGIQPAAQSGKLDHKAHAVGIHHIALWARSRKEVEQFHDEFLLPGGIEITDPPAEYPIYAPGYFAVFFVDPNGIWWELTYTPRIPMPWDVLKTLKEARKLRKEHPEWKHHPAKEMMRQLPSRKQA